MKTHPITQHRRDKGLTLDALSQELGIGKATLWKWEKRGVPPTRVREVERVTGISSHDLRPDIFGPAPLPKTRGSNSGVAAS